MPPQAQKKPEPEELLTGTALFAAYEKVRRLKQREFDIVGQLKDLYRLTYQDYRREMEDWFYREYFVAPLFAPIWDMPRMKAVGGVEPWIASFDAMATATHKEAEDLLTDELADSYEDGYLGALWDVYRTGEDVSDAMPPDRETLFALLLAGGIAGLSYAQRLQRWTDESQIKFRQQLKGSVALGEPFADTVQWFNGLENFVAGKVSALGEDEVHQAWSLGQTDALSAFTEMVAGEVWISRQDALVCPICQELHMTITTLEPIVDSHPGCRCIKIPILLGADRRPTDYDYFLADIGWSR